VKHKQEPPHRGGGGGIFEKKKVQIKGRAAVWASGLQMEKKEAVKGEILLGECKIKLALSGMLSGRVFPKNLGLRS